MGDPPFDELYSLGLERDNDRHLRGHRGTRDGKKGAGPMGPDYFLVNLELNKEVYRGGLWRIILIPYVDSGKTFDESGYFGSRVWQWDAGVQLKLTIFERISLIVSYDKSLRSGENTFCWCSGGDRVIPLPMKLLWLDEQCRYLLVLDFDPGRIGVSVQAGPNGKPLGLGGVGDEVHH